MSVSTKARGADPAHGFTVDIGDLLGDYLSEHEGIDYSDLTDPLSTYLATLSSSRMIFSSKSRTVWNTIGISTRVVRKSDGLLL